ncbi:MAG: UDP-N-acetylenolpyruvoylglucosamine reductase, partial [Ruminiclostridium sp.]|nr:UDP-N-acetylenolpyruvoylglucosamine reductase [Ruminiclostridium sp.]
TDVTLKLQKGDKKAITEKMQELMNKRREKQPLEYPSAGSTFKRPEGDFAGRLIEAAGMRGFAVGGAQVSEKHCGFVVNKGNAAFDDVVSVINAVREKVKETLGRDLECEVIIWQ